MTGETVLVRPINENLKPFDILIFHQHDKLICHMYIKESALGTNSGLAEYLTRPYSGNLFDYPVAKSNVLGIVCSHKVSLFRKIFYLLKRRSS